MDRRRFLLTSLAGALAGPLPAEAQQAKVARLGVLLFGTPDTDAFPVIRRGLSALGYVEGQNILFEHRYAEGRPERLANLASDLVRSNPDLIIAAGGDVAPFAKQTTGTIPIVMITSADPVQGGPRRQPGAPRWKRDGPDIRVVGLGGQASPVSQGSGTRRDASRGSLEPEPP
jgi:putative ABC transport system substrate-binding protein